MSLNIRTLLTILFTLNFYLVNGQEIQDTTVFRASIKADEGNLNEALNILKQCIRNRPSAEAYYTRGRVNGMKNNIKLAISDYTSALKLDLNYSYAFAYRATAYSELNKNKLALIDINKAIALSPKNGEFYGLRSAIKAILKDKVGSCEDMKTAFRLGSKIAEANLKNACE